MAVDKVAVTLPKELYEMVERARAVDVGIRVTIDRLGGFVTDWAGSSLPFASPLSEHDELRRILYDVAFT